MVTFVDLVLTLDLTLEAACEGITGTMFGGIFSCYVCIRHMSDGISLGQFLSPSFHNPIIHSTSKRRVPFARHLGPQFRIPLHRRLPSVRLAEHRQISRNHQPALQATAPSITKFRAPTRPPFSAGREHRLPHLPLDCAVPSPIGARARPPDRVRDEVASVKAKPR